MKMPLDKDLNKAYEAFNQNHDHLREDLMASLPKRCKPEEMSRITQVRKFIGDTIMKSRITKIAAAAVIIVAVALSITVLEQSVTPAYAIEQTVEAYQGIRYLYFYYYPCTIDKLGKEAWIQYDANGNIKNIRVNLYNREGKNKHLEEVWREGKTFLWRSYQNTLEIDESTVYTPMMLDFAEGYDPKQAVEYLYKDQQEGRCQIDIEEGVREDEPIRITGRYLQGKYLTSQRDHLPPIRDVLVVDPKTKLVTRIEVYKVLEDRIELHGVYKDYNYQPFDPNIFDIEKEVPDDAIITIDYYTEDVNTLGLEQGTLTREQVAHAVTREFFNALISKDYEKAGQLFGGMLGDEVEQRFGELNVVRLVSIGDRVKAQGGFPSYYPCVVEIEENGKLSQWQPKVYIGKVPPNHMNRWKIKGVF